MTEELVGRDQPQPSDTCLELDLVICRKRGEGEGRVNVDLRRGQAA